VIIREEYLNKLKALKDKHIIKIVTGIRRCGKSTLLLQFQDWLLEQGVEKSQIIFINFEDLEYEEFFETYYSDDADTNYKNKFIDEFIKFSALGMVNDKSQYAIHCLNIGLSHFDINEKKVNYSLDEIVLKSATEGELFIFDISKKEFKFNGRQERDECRLYTQALDCFWENVDQSDEAQRIFKR